MTYASLETKYIAYASASGVTHTILGYVDEIQLDRTDNYPAIAAIPPDIPLKTRTPSKEASNFTQTFVIFDKYNRNTGTGSRAESWDNINTVAGTFFGLIGGDSSIEINNPDNILTTVYDTGQIADQVVAIRYELNLTAYC